MLGWGVCPGQGHCAGRWWPQPWSHRARGAGGPLSQLRTEGVAPHRAGLPPHCSVQRPAGTTQEH